MERLLARILVADVVGYLDLMGNDDTETLARLSTCSSACPNFRSRAMKQATRRHHAWRQLGVAALLFCVLDAPAVVARESTPPLSAPAVLTLHEAAHLLRIGIDELDRLARQNDIPGRRIGVYWRFNRAALLVTVAANAHTFEAEDLEKLKVTGRCIKCDLFGAKLIGANLPGVNLSGADLNRARLIGADLRGANLRGANLTWADLSGANLSEADLSGANLRGTNLIRANLSGVNLSGANLSNASLKGATLIKAKLSGANLNGVSMIRSDLGGINLVGADLSSADLSGADLSDANLGRAKLSGANLMYADLPRADLSGADLSEANLTGPTLCEPT